MHTSSKSRTACACHTIIRLYKHIIPVINNYIQIGKVMPKTEFRESRLMMQENKQCPIMRQVLQGCRTCPATCTNPDLQCTRQCKEGCGCPSGQLIDTLGNRCVNPSDCPNSPSKRITAWRIEY